MLAHTPKHLRLCADDYGLAPGVNFAIRDLIERGRLNATSVMVVTPAFTSGEVAALKDSQSGTSATIGLHVTLTAPFRPLTADNGMGGDAFAPVETTLKQAVLRRFDTKALKGEVVAQLHAFAEAFGRMPDFVDGHQHVQLFPQVRDAVLHAVAELAPTAWVRQCGRVAPMRGSVRDPKAMLLDILSVRFRRRARRQGLATNPAFAGTYTFSQDADFANLFPGFLHHLPENSVVMCHPGVVDDELVRLDPLTTLRAREYAYLQSDAFPSAMAAAGYTLT